MKLTEVSVWRFASFVPGLFMLFVAADVAQTESTDCEIRAIDDSFDGQLLTRAEKIELMDQRFYEALEEFQECLREKPSAAIEQSSSLATGQEGSTASSSLAVQTMQGTEEASPEETVASSTPEGDLELAGSTNVNPLIHGKIPEDIPVVNNDDEVAAQIRQAAMSEPDPNLQQRLWNEYRKYKGLPVKEISNDE